MSEYERFDDRWMPEPMSGCWLWIRGTDKNGYGGFVSQVTSSRQAHRVAYERWVGPVPPGLDLDHLCRTPSCVNPEHLEAVTHRVNCLRGRSPAARAARTTHCPQGHPYDEANTGRYPNGHRRCRTCHRTRERERHARKGAKR